MKARYCYKHSEQTLDHTVWVEQDTRGRWEVITRRQHEAGENHALGYPTTNQLWKVTFLPLHFLVCIYVESSGPAEPPVTENTS